MKLFFCIVLSLVFMSGQIGAANQPNLIYLVLEGASIGSMATLIQKNRLPNLKKIYSKGNFRSLSNPNQKIDYESSYIALVTGRKIQDNEMYPLPRNELWVSRVLQHNPETNVRMILSESSNPDVEVDITSMVFPFDADNIKVRTLSAEKANQFMKKVIQDINNIEEPYIIMANVTHIDKAGHRFREGAARYSSEIKRFDRSLGDLIRYLKSKNQWNNTQFIIAPNYGFYAKSQSYKNNSKSWVIATQKSLRKGTIYDIVPSIYHSLGMDSDDSSEMLGRSLFAKDTEELNQ